MFGQAHVFIHELQKVKHDGVVGKVSCQVKCGGDEQCVSAGAVERALVSVMRRGVM